MHNRPWYAFVPGFAWSIRGFFLKFIINPVSVTRSVPPAAKHHAPRGGWISNGATDAWLLGFDRYRVRDSTNLPEIIKKKREKNGKEKKMHELKNSNWLTAIRIIIIVYNEEKRAELVGNVGGVKVEFVVGDCLASLATTRRWNAAASETADTLRFRDPRSSSRRRTVDLACSSVRSILAETGGDPTKRLVPTTLDYRWTRREKYKWPVSEEGVQRCDAKQSVFAIFDRELGDVRGETRRGKFLLTRWKSRCHVFRFIWIFRITTNCIITGLWTF